MSDRVGVLLNPIAGFGGTLALHGTDELPAGRFAEAVAAGRAGGRLLRALQVWRERGGTGRLLTSPGLLGADALRGGGFDAELIGPPVSSPRTTRRDTIDAARGLVAAGIDVLMFSGGDGTATDLAEAVGQAVPVIGVPSGVKMHSQVFSRSPEAAGRLLAEVTAGRGFAEPADVLDVVADGGTEVIAVLNAARASQPLQGGKSTGVAPADAAESRAIASEIVRTDHPDATWIIGPGTTASAVAAALGFTATLRGVDVRHPSGDVEHNVDEERLLAIAAAALDPRLVLGVVGGQGFLLGRGNQQLSPRVIRAVGADRVWIVATRRKVSALMPPVLYVDADDGRAGSRPDSTHPLLGYRRVRTGSRQTTVMNVVDASA